MRNEKGQFVKGYKNGYEDNLALGRGWNKDIPCSEETKLKIGLANKGKESWNKDKKTGQIVWNKGKKGLQKAWNKGMKHPERQGENCHLWKGGITPINQQIRNSPEYKEWRKKVFERDNYTCVLCGDKTSGNLNVDHILPFSIHPEFRLDINNGRTLCVPCHKQTPSYLNKKLKIKK